MARTLHHGSPAFVDPLVSYVLEPNDVIVDKKKFLSFLTSIGIPTTVHEGIMNDVKAEVWS